MDKIRTHREEAVTHLQSAHDAELCQLRDRLADADSSRRKQIQSLKDEHAEQLEQLKAELRDNKERSETVRMKLEREKQTLEAEFAKVLPELEMVIYALLCR